MQIELHEPVWGGGGLEASAMAPSVGWAITLLPKRRMIVAKRRNVLGAIAVVSGKTNEVSGRVLTIVFKIKVTKGVKVNDLIVDNKQMRYY